MPGIQHITVGDIGTERWHGREAVRLRIQYETRHGVTILPTLLVESRIGLVRAQRVEVTECNVEIIHVPPLLTPQTDRVRSSPHGSSLGRRS